MAGMTVVNSNKIGGETDSAGCVVCLFKGKIKRAGLLAADGWYGGTRSRTKRYHSQLGGTHESLWRLTYKDVKEKFREWVGTKTARSSKQSC